jgi:uroporphyrinogen III methyltransferase/synthase
MTRPLEGVTVVVTRARAQAELLSSALSRAGAQVVTLPVIAIADPADGAAAMRRAMALVIQHHYDWVVFSSVNAVERFAGMLGEGRSLGYTKIAAVGDATSAALAAHGLATDLVPETASAGALAAAMPVAPRSAPMTTSAEPTATPAAADAGRGRVFFPRAAQARDVITSRLRAKGWEVDDVEAYRTVVAGPSDGATEDAFEGASHADVVTFTSPSTVRFYVELAAGRRMPPVVACIGPVTARAASRAGLRVQVVADEQSADGLVRALVEYRVGHRAR